ncbi:retrovirus-related Pol polyprotein from transposon 17.6 [Trichonephila clavipes]|uniref:RNA-directed DNA polymerase n=1 Tax=Trichonephila clavipes TaxID=2585209 RepID=A0A8X6RM53_TRICX|nr:retrovirus-related Pol polyprotein from transposon 17.6 [Trichonephila clavipes]
MDPNSTKYTSFVTHEGQYEFLRVPFGLSNSPSVFQRFIYTVFRKLIRDNILIVYMDDLLIPSQNEAEGLNKLRLVLQTAADFGLELIEKCNFLQRKIEFLGYIIENGTIKPSPSKTQAVQNFPQPQTPRQHQSFIGLTSYFRKFIPNYARIARPLSDLPRDNVKFKFGPTEIASFQELKNILSENPVLHVFQQGYPLELHTDASSLGFGAVLLQKSDDGLFHPIHYFSRKTTVQQEKYSSYELEVLAIIEALKKFRSYLLDKGSAFTSTEFQKFCQEESIEHIQITTGVPRGNGQIERMHETIIPVLTKLTIEEPEKWFKHVHRLQRIMNSTTTRSTTFTPFEVLIGVKMKQKEYLKIKHLLEDELSEQFINKRDTLRNEAKENILCLQGKNKKQYNKHRKPAYNYKPSDTVAIQRTQFGTGLKLRPKYFGPYEVTKVNKHDRYEEQKIGQHEGPNVTSTSADKMKKWCTH